MEDITSVASITMLLRVLHEAIYFNIAARGDGIIIGLTHGCKTTIKGIRFRLVVNQMSTVKVNSYASDTRTVSYTSYLTIKRGKIIS